MCGSGEQSANYYYLFFFLLILVSKHWFSLKMWWTGGWWWMWSGLVAASLFDLDSSCAAQEPRLTDSLEKGSWGDKEGLPHLSNYSFPPDAKHVASWKKKCANYLASAGVSSISPQFQLLELYLHTLTQVYTCPQSRTSRRQDCWRANAVC